MHILAAYIDLSVVCADDCICDRKSQSVAARITVGAVGALKAFEDRLLFLLQCQTVLKIDWFIQA